MRVSQKQILEALGLMKGDFDAEREMIGIALRGIETTLDNVGIELDNDHEVCALGDASNLIQLIRENL